MSRTAFVTGGTGFLGINLIELLVEKGWNVTALHRPTSDLTYLKRFPGVALAEGDVTDRESLDRAIPDGTEAVFHVAGDVSFWSKRKARQDATNIDGTRNMLEASAAKGVKVFVHTSSVAAWGKVSGEVDENTPMKGKDSWINYCRSKHLGEVVALKSVGCGMKVVVLNPSDILGPYDIKNWGSTFLLLRDKKLPFTAGGTLCVTHVRDVAEAHLAAVDKGRDGERYIVAGENHKLVEAVGEMAHISGVEAPAVAPAWMLKAFSWFSVTVSMFTKSEPDITPELAELLTWSDHPTYSSKKAQTELGYKIRPMSDAVRDTYNWFKQEGLL